MKTRRIVLIFSLILCLGMLVACNADVAEQNAGDKLAYATFKNDAKEFSVSYDGYQSFDNLYWYYKADKLDDYGQTGDTGDYYAKVPGDSEGKGLDGKTEALSEGKWQFTLMAFEAALTETEEGSKRYDAEHVTTQSAIYSGSTPASGSDVIVIRRNQTNYIPVTVTPVAENGHINFANAYYEWEAAGSVSNPDVKITITMPVSTTEYVITKELSYSSSNYPISGYIWLETDGTTGTIAAEAPSSDYTNDIPAGVYAASIVITPVDDEDNIIFASQDLSLKVFGGLTATITGSLKELLSYENYFAVPEVDVKVFNPTTTSETVITSTYVAKDDKTTETTKVTFPADALTSTNQHSLEIEVFSAAVSESKFVATTTDSQAVAGLDLTLTKVTRTSEGDVTEETVSEFDNNAYATIVTYINPSLEDVAVKYNGLDKDQPIATDDTFAEDRSVAAILTDAEQDAGKLGYNPTTGYLSFKTNHFSEYYVQAKVYAQNVTTGKYYHSLRAAIDDAQENQTIKLLKATETGSSYTITEPFYVKTKGLTLDLNEESLTVTKNFSFVIEADDVTVKNGNVVSGTNSAKASGINSYVLVVNNCKNAVLDGLTINGGVSAGGSTGETPNAGAAHNMLMRNCEVTGGDYYAICSQNYSDVTIESGTYSETSTAVTSKGVLQGHFVGDDGPEGGIIVTGGRFNGTINTGNTPNEIVLKGGTFDHNPTAYVAEGYVATYTDNVWTVAPYVCCTINNEEVTYYSSLQDALDSASNGETVKLLKDIELSGSGSLFKYQSTTADRSAKLDLNGKIIRGILNNTASCQVFKVGSLSGDNPNYQHSASLTILDSTVTEHGYDRGAIIAEPSVYSDSWTVAVSTFSVQRYGALTIESGKILVEGGTVPVSPSAENPYAIDVLTNTGVQPATLIVNGGYIASNIDTGVGIRTFCNSSVGSLNLTINNGYIYGRSRAVMLQIPGNLTGENKALLNCEINGGTLHSDSRALDVLNFNSTDKDDSGFNITVNGGEFISDHGANYTLVPFEGNDILYISNRTQGPYTPIHFTYSK